MTDFYVTMKTRNAIKGLESKIMNGLMPVESIIYDVQHNKDGWFAYTWHGQNKISIKPCDYEYVGSVVHKSINTPQIFEVYKKKGE